MRTTGGRRRTARAAEPASSPPLPRLGIPALQLNDGPLGVRNIDGGAEGRATALPSSQALAASFDPELAYESGRVMGREARDRGFNVLLAGGANVERDAWNGRNFEYLGEDPILAGRLVTAQITRDPVRRASFRPSSTSWRIPRRPIATGST